MKKLVIVVLVFVSILLTGCSSNPSSKDLYEITDDFLSDYSDGLLYKDTLCNLEGEDAITEYFTSLENYINDLNEYFTDDYYKTFSESFVILFFNRAIINMNCDQIELEIIETDYSIDGEITEDSGKVNFSITFLATRNADDSTYEILLEGWVLFDLTGRKNLISGLGTTKLSGYPDY